MSFTQAVKAVISNYVGFSGRARRSEYWYFVLFQILLSIVLNVLGAITRAPGFFSILGILVSLALLLPGLAVSVRRLHDTNRSGWWLLIALIPLVGLIVLIVFFVQEGTKGQNQYGPDPKAAAPAAAVA